MDLITKLSQAHASLSFTIVYLLIFMIGGLFWAIFAFVFALVVGLLERNFFNKKVAPIPETCVIITGCSSGFGFHLATRLANKGIYVFAGVRKQDDANNLTKSTILPANIHPLILDVTNEGHILEAVNTVNDVIQKKGLKLLSLINNAGYAEYAPIETMSIKRMKKMYDVNVFGVISMSQAFLPLLRKYYIKSPLNSRIINISSAAGNVSVPSSGQYCSTKFALESLSDALRMEIKPWNISVILVEPGRFHTEFQAKAYVDLTIDGFSPLDDNITKHYNTMMKHINEESAKRNRPRSELCVDIIEDALFDSKPLARYKAGRDAQIGVPFSKILNSQESIMDFIMGRKWKKLQK